MKYIEDVHQTRKVRHKLKNILVIVLFATLADADDWVEIAMFASTYQDYLQKYIDLKNGVPSHDTINKVMGLISPEILQQLYGKWQELLNRNEGETLRKHICIDGKTIKDENGERKEYQYYISSLEPNIEIFKRAVGALECREYAPASGRNIQGRHKYHLR